MRVSITGHRPEKIADFGWVQEALSEVFVTVQPSQVIQGMAAGVDLLSAVVAESLKIPYVCARPWATHTPRNSDYQLYQQVINNAVEVVDVNPAVSYLGPWLYQRRNEWMVDHADIVVAVWDGTAGGTKNCVLYAQKQGKQIIRINPASKTVDYPETVTQTDQLF